MKAVGVHVFAGGFTKGVQEVFEVDTQLETHGFGLDTASKMCGVECINSPAEEWPHIEASFCYGNPRCTGFSCITSGYGADTHGAWAKQTRDIHELCTYAVNRYPVICWESVQQAYTTGRELLDYLRDEIFVPNGYRIAHVFMTTASFGNAQHRKRYFFFAYKNDLKFNIEPPVLGNWQPTLYDAIWDVRDNECSERSLHTKDAEYDENSYTTLTKHEWELVPILPNGYCANRFAKYQWHRLPTKMKNEWLLRTSPMPFSMHCIQRLQWMVFCPTIHSSAGRWIHPQHHRPLTVGELARVMGWGDDIPVGPNPIGQIAKGVCPQAGTWLAQQAAHCLNDVWGGEDWESSYDDRTGQWVGQDTPNQVEKVFNLTRYYASAFSMDRFECGLPKYQHDVGLNSRNVVGPEPNLLEKR